MRSHLSILSCLMLMLVCGPAVADARHGHPIWQPRKQLLPLVSGPWRGQVKQGTTTTRDCTPERRSPAVRPEAAATPLASWFVQSLQPQACESLKRLLASTKRGPATFDADGTLWGGDVGEGFFLWMLKKHHYPAKRAHALRHAWASYKRGQLSGEKMYELMVTSMAGMRETDVKTLATHYFDEQHSRHIYTPMQTLVSTLAATGFSPWVVSGSPLWVVEAGARHFGIPPDHVIGLSVRVENGRLTDEIVRPVPWMEGKADRILQELGRRPAIAAGNSQGDAYMLKIASDLPLVINPAPGFQHTALQRGWPIERFTPADEIARMIRPSSATSDLVRSLSAR
jgi:phosphatidylglycerophosphatase C